MSVSVLLENVCETTGEGPHWDEETQSLYFVDILCGGVCCWDSRSGKITKHKLDDSVGFIIPREKGGFIIGLGRKLAFLDWKSGQFSSLHEVEKKGTKNRFNDAKCDASGRLWAGTMGYEGKPAVPELEMGYLFSLDRDHTLSCKVDKVDISNGLAWSSDNKTMYYIDSIPRKVYAFDYDLTTGSITNRRTCVDFGEGTMDTLGYPDGMCIDQEDKIWVACYNGGKVVRFDPLTGTQLQTIEFPAKRITSCCFGGPNHEDLFVTCAKTGLSEEEFRTQQPLAGSVFKVTGLGVRGVPLHKYAG